MPIDRRTFLATAAAGVGVLQSAFASAAPPSGLSASAMRSDLDLLLRCYETVHPGLTRYLRPGQFAAHVDAARAWADRERTPSEFFLALARLTASVQCGHSFPNPVNQSDAVKSALFGGRDRLPFSFRWLRGRMIVTGARGGRAQVPRGAEILAVDDVSAADLLRRMMPLARADGGNDAKRLAQLGLDPRARYAPFDVYRAALLGNARRGVVKVRLRDPAGGLRTMELPALTEGELAAARARTQENLGWRFELGTDGLGVLTMPSWATYNSNWDWRAFIDTAVDRLVDERARGLIVDLRGNEGGSDCGWHLLERIAPTAVSLPTFQRRVRYRALGDTLRGALDTWDNSFRDWGAAAVGPRPDGFYDLRREGGDTEVIAPRGRRFTSPVTVLVDSACSSATFQFAHAAKESGLARLVGEPTGGNRRGINGGAFFFVRLPETGFEVDLPIIGFFAAGAEPDAGAIPHDLVRPTVDDIVRGFDRPLRVASRLLLEGGGRRASLQ
jgi:hypothetical protein